MKTFFQENKGLIFLLAFGLCASLLGIFLLEWHSAPQSWAVIQVGQETWLEIDLSQSPTGTEWRIPGQDDQFNVVQIQDGAIGVVLANCPDQVCVLRGFQDGSGGPIICMPHQLLIRFSGEGYDEVSG